MNDLAFDSDRALCMYPELAPLIDGLALYFNHGIRPGHFLTAVLCNDLQEAFARASPQSVSTLPSLMRLLYNHAPAGAFGSKDRFDAWRSRMFPERQP